MTSRGERPENGGISENGERWITIVIAVAFISLIPSVVLGVLLWHEIDNRSSSNAALIEQLQHHEEVQARDRAAARKAIRDADVQNCEEDELVKERLREIVRFKPEEIALTLEQLGIDPQSERGQQLMMRQKTASEKAINALAPRDCSRLPDPTEPFETN